MMGSPTDEPERKESREDPQVNVAIAKPFAAGKFAVTRDQFEAFVKASGFKVSEECITTWRKQPGSFQKPGFEQTGAHPAVCVSWDDAEAYVAWLSQKTGRTYRLLSEAEHEYVTRAGTTTPFWWGSSITPARANYDGRQLYKGGGSEGEYR